MIEPTTSRLPAPIASAIVGIPAALIPASVKALDRLVGASIDIPVAWLNQQRAKIDAKTKSIEQVEFAVGRSIAGLVSSDTDLAERAANVLLGKGYRRQVNREAVGMAALDELRSKEASTEATDDTPPPPPVEEDWLNIFERYAEDASSDRMQKLWGRVLAGEVRKPGQFSVRTLRFLSEFSQGDALLFSAFCTQAFGDAAPKALVKPDDQKDMRHLLYLEDAGLIKGADGLGLQVKRTFDGRGFNIIREQNLVMVLQGDPGASFSYQVLPLTQLGQELVSLIPGRDAKAAARAVANCIRIPVIKMAFLGVVSNSSGSISAMEILWQGAGATVDVAVPSA